MNYQIIGAVCVFSACGGFGFLLAAHHIQCIQLVRQLIGALDYMACELQYRSTALPELCRDTAFQCNGRIKLLFTFLAEELESQISPNASYCMEAAVKRSADFPKYLQQIFYMLGQSFGQFDLSGQLRGLEVARKECREILQTLMVNKDTRVRSYQTLGLCAGAAIAILFI